MTWKATIPLQCYRVREVFLTILQQSKVGVALFTQSYNNPKHGSALSKFLECGRDAKRNLAKSSDIGLYIIVCIPKPDHGKLGSAEAVD